VPETMAVLMIPPIEDEEFIIFDIFEFCSGMKKSRATFSPCLYQTLQAT
jgi:hypothetical protein